MSPSMTRQPELDQACAEAVDLARSAAEETAGPGQVGEYVGREGEADRVVTHLFASLDPAYVGWRWAVTVVRGARSKMVTVSESLLLPGPGSLLAPAWVPWTERVRPGDLKAGDLMPASAEDERLVPFVAIAGERGLFDWDDSVAWQVGRVPRDVPVAGEAVPAEPAEPGEAAGGAGGEAGAAEAGAAPQERRPARTRRGLALRPARVLSSGGRDEAAARWHAGEHGPSSPLASSAPAPCLTCGFMVRLSGPLGSLFGVCANELAPDDGKVVSVDHGCGAHSDGDLAAGGAGAVLPAVDELGYDMMSPGAAVPDSVLETIDHELA